MILSDSVILKEIENGNIIIEPFQRELLNPNSVDLTLGNVLKVYPREYKTDVKGTIYIVPLDVKEKQHTIDIVMDDRGYTLYPGEIYLYACNEKIGVKGNICAQVQAKCFGKGTLIRMYDNSLKKIELINQGDLILGIDGLPKKVKRTHKGVDVLYEIFQKRGISYITNGYHILPLKGTGYRKYKKNNIYTISVNDFYNNQKELTNRIKGYKSPSILPINTTLLIPPYLLGLWLGDGCHKHARLTINVNDLEIIDYLKQTLPFVKFHLYASGAYTVILSTEKKDKFNLKNQILENLKLLGIWGNKRIPSSYFNSSLTQRLELLAGIIDTDGTSTGTAYVICQKRFDLITDIQKLCLSCGFSSKIKKNIDKFGYVSYKLTITGNLMEIPLKLSRKRLSNIGMLNKYDSPLTITKLNYGEYYGFELEGDDEIDKLFFLEDNTVAHNSSLGRLGLDIVVGPAGFIDSGFEGSLVLELRATRPIIVYPNMKICQIKYERVEGDVLESYDKKSGSKYMNQTGVQESLMYKNFNNV